MAIVAIAAAGRSGPPRPRRRQPARTAGPRRGPGPHSVDGSKAPAGSAPVPGIRVTEPRCRPVRCRAARPARPTPPAATPAPRGRRPCPGRHRRPGPADPAAAPEAAPDRDPRLPTLRRPPVPVRRSPKLAAACACVVAGLLAAACSGSTGGGTGGTGGGAASQPAGPKVTITPGQRQPRRQARPGDHRERGGREAHQRVGAGRRCAVAGKMNAARHVVAQQWALGVSTTLQRHRDRDGLRRQAGHHDQHVHDPDSVPDVPDA